MFNSYENMQQQLLAQQQMQQQYWGTSGATYPPHSPLFASQLQIPVRKGKKMSMLREYMNKHRDTIFTLMAVVLIDHFVLNGALRKRIQAIVEAICHRLEKTLQLPLPGETHEG